MSVETHIGNTAVLKPPAESPVFSSLVAAAALEFHACLQLLAERARFLTAADGVAIAIRAGEEFTYCASVGTSVPEINAMADSAKGLIRECVSSAKPVFAPAQTGFSLATPISKDTKVVGFIQLVSGHDSFEERDSEAIGRLADLAATALDLREGAEQAKSRMLDPEKPQPSRPTPPLWHAGAAQPTAPEPRATSVGPALQQLAACASCGFPVSPGRRLCVDCDAKQPTTIEQDKKPMFTIEKQESWANAHGYTIASILVSTLVAVVIYLLR